MGRGESLKKLVERHGYGIHVRSTDKTVKPFQILKEYDAEYYVVLMDGYGQLNVMKECATTNDYVLAAR